MQVEIGVVIWSAVKPMIKIYLILLTGFFLAKQNMLTVETTRSLSDIVLTVLLPCLSFNKIVANIDGGDIKNVGIICLTAVIIFGTGGLFALLVRTFSPVPKRWYGGILAGGIFPNISDIPIAYIQTMATGSIMTPEEGEKGIAHVIIFLAIFLFCVFNLGGFRLIEYDFRDMGDEESQEKVEGENQNIETSSSLDNSIQEDPLETIPDSASVEQTIDSDDDSEDTGQPYLKEQPEPVPLTEDVLKHRRNTASSLQPAVSNKTSGSETSNQCHGQTISRVPTRQSITSTAASLRSLHRVAELRRLPSQTMEDVIDEYSEAGARRPDESNRARLAHILTSEVGVTGSDITKTSPSFFQKYHLSMISFLLQNCLRPCSLALIISLIIAFIPWLKALFVETGVNMPNAPDDLPPLNFIMDYTAYIGAASVPMALLLLGGCIARLNLGNLSPGFWRSAVILVILRLCIMPILGVLWVDRLTKAGWIGDEDSILKFVICISWGLPSMTTQVYFTAFIMDPDASDKTQMDCTSFYLLIQYPLLVISMPIVVTYVVKNVM